MPGFFETLTRMFKGEPVYQNEDASKDVPRAKSASSAPLVTPSSDRTDGKTAPIMVIERIMCDIDGSHMTLKAEIKNRHSDSVFLDKILILNTRFELDRTMAAQEEHTFRVYSGLRPTNTHLTKCELHYRNGLGDYFASIHFVEFRQLQDGMFVVDDIKFLPPIKDI